MGEMTSWCSWEHQRVDVPALNKRGLAAHAEALRTSTDWMRLSVGATSAGSFSNTPAFETTLLSLPLSRDRTDVLTHVLKSF